MSNAKNLLVGVVAVGLLPAMGAVSDGLRGPCRARGMTPAAWATTVNFFVAPEGHDGWSGRVADPGKKNDGPFATITLAREAVGALRKTRKEPRTIRVVHRGGT